MAETFGIPATTCALNGGEDYELLFTVNAASFADISACPWISIIGHTCAAEDGIKLITTANNKVAIQAQGWNPLA
jgi:thiamine-monophosphate kinase